MGQDVFDQDAVDPGAGISQDSLQELAAQAARNRNVDPPPPDSQTINGGSINFLNLLIRGGVLMVPIAIMSFLVVAFTIERTFALRRGRVFPRAIRRILRQQADAETVEPDELYEASLRHPSAASRILQDALQKVGRPIPEMEAAISEGTQREAEILFGNVRWLTLAAAVTPLIGLLGTVWGMIIAFYNTTQLGDGSNKAEFLAEGIYVALVTTLGGLAVAIPAAIFAHYFEGKITRLLTQIETEYRRFVPKFEGFEGRTRFDLGPKGLRSRTANHVESPAGELQERLPVSSSARARKQRV
jgi:biopolymer transport protein ExbB